MALSVRSHGGYGDVDRTLAVCRMLAARVRREVNNKLKTGLKNPGKARDED